MSVEELKQRPQQEQQELQKKQQEKTQVSEKSTLLARYHSKFLEKIILNNKLTIFIKLFSFLSVLTLSSTFYINYKAFVKYAGDEVYFKSMYYEIPIENQISSMFFSEQFQTNLLTWDSEFTRTYKKITEAISSPGKWVEYDSKRQYETCVNKICFISTYGAADGIPIKIFSYGMTIFSIILLVVMEFRTQLTYNMFSVFFEKMEKKYEDSEKELKIFKRSKSNYGKLLVFCRLAGSITLVLINIMAYFAFHKYFATHVGSASMITCTMGTFLVLDGFLMKYTFQRIVPELRYQNLLEEIQNRNPLYKLWNSKAGLTFYWVVFAFVLFNCGGFVFNFTHQSIHEYLFITIPVYLQLMYVWNYDYFKEIIRQLREL